MNTSPVSHSISQDFAGELQRIDTRFLLAIAHGDIDPAALAREELAARGIGPDGRWVGFSEARRAFPS